MYGSGSHKYTQWGTRTIEYNTAICSRRWGLCYDSNDHIKFVASILLICIHLIRNQWTHLASNNNNKNYCLFHFPFQIATMLFLSHSSRGYAQNAGETDSLLFISYESYVPSNNNNKTFENLTKIIEMLSILLYWRRDFEKRASLSFFFEDFFVVRNKNRHRGMSENRSFSRLSSLFVKSNASTWYFYFPCIRCTCFNFTVIIFLCVLFSSCCCPFFNVIRKTILSLVVSR